MLTSHAYQSSHDHFSQGGGMYHQENAENKPIIEGATTKIMNPSPTTCGDPFNEGVPAGGGNEGSGPTGINSSPSHQFGGDDEFDTMSINIPSSALEEQQQGHQGGREWVRVWSQVGNHCLFSWFFESRQSCKQDVCDECQFIGQEQEGGVGIVVVDRLDHHPASGHERLEWDDTSGFSLALSQHLVDLPYGLEASKGIEHVLVLAAVLV